MSVKKVFSLMLAVLLAVIVTVMPTAQVAARAAASDGDAVSGGDTAPDKYISEVRVGMGKSKDAAAKSLAGYTILKDDKGNYADLNKDAGSNSWIGSKGDKVVLLGYKTTNDPKQAITDLAVMNMDGGYSVKNYEVLMDRYLDTQIKPMIEGFMATIREYRENYASGNPANKKRAQYAHDMLNLLYDDDTGALMGDLLLNETKWEKDAADPAAYDRLSDEEKKKCGDLLTIFCQANGQATLSIQNLLARAADTSDTTWIERFAAADGAALAEELFPDMTPTDAGAMMASMFGDDAGRILSMWDRLGDDLGKYDEAVEFLENYNTKELEEAIDEVEKGADENATEKQLTDALVASAEADALQAELNYYYSVVALHDSLERTEYFDEFTLLDYFSQTKEEAASDMSAIYALVASLSPGQRAGLDYMTLRELILAAMTDADQYAAVDDELKAAASIYEGVDRMIYTKDAVALTNEALRKGANDSVDNYPLSALTTVMWATTAASLAASIGTWVKFASEYKKYTVMHDKLDNTFNILGPDPKIRVQIYAIKNVERPGTMTNQQLVTTFGEENADRIIEARELLIDGEEMHAKSAFSRNLAIGFTVVTVALTALSVWMTYRDLCDYYDTEFSPIPAYMVDEADITAKNAKGETIVIKNQTAYYKAALCNRTKKDEKFEEIGDKADLNGDVGRKWVALYSVKNEAQDPILADSFKVVYGTSNVPLDYDRGIHKFGSGAAFDMNNTYYAWNHGKGGIYVYYKVDDTVPSRANAVGTVQTAGMLVGVGGGGLLVGMLAGSLLVNRRGRKKEEEEKAA